ncbi:GNAT family N-acetyltransferase [Hyphobacterium marinum]|uniref:GNAT family N-acetyltransferase n=1 Tax=Hyphobacterium marinum TaxID=3116574 RepID=A0ABU7LVD1_9PROT|nr:GNAT family N-acetyltransferase [Hyphobacterium sp. Y6023]MEE2565512.1 GNAT family N-acetyltransferase [Hyphobacterium sp. Y6023]
MTSLSDALGPVLETPRLRLRPPQESDLEPLIAVMGDEETARYIGGVQSPPLVWRALAALIGHWAIRGYGFFVLEDRETGDWIGRVGPWYPHEWPQPEVGWTIARQHWGKGYAAEAAARALDWVFDDLGWESVAHLIHKDNAGSASVARKLGSTNSGREVAVPGFDMQVDIWGQSREDWSRNRAALQR